MSITSHGYCYYPIWMFAPAHSSTSAKGFIFHLSVFTHRDCQTQNPNIEKPLRAEPDSPAMTGENFEPDQPLPPIPINEYLHFVTSNWPQQGTAFLALPSQILKFKKSDFFVNQPVHA